MTDIPAAASPSRVSAALKDAFFSGLIATGVFGPLIGFKTVQDMQNRLVLENRWGLLAIIVALVAAGRFLISLYSTRARSDQPKAASTFVLPKTVRDGLPAAGLVVLFMYPLMIYSVTGGSGALKWIDNFGIQILIYIMLAWGLNIVVGLAGLLDLGYVAFYAVGAYAYALLATQVIPATFPVLGPWAFWVCLPVAGILAAMWGVLLGFPVLRLRGDYLAIVTLAFGEIIRLVLINWKEFSNGYEGISTIPRPTFFGTPFNASDTGFAAVWGLEFSPVYRTMFLYYVIVCLSLLTAWVSMRLRHLPVGRAWEALREDEIACRSLGINTVNTKLTAFAIGAMFGGFAGSFFAARQGFISPESFTFMESATILAIVVLGGMGSLLGTAIAAVAMIGGTELLRELDWMKAIFGNDFDPVQYRMLIFGFAMVAIMIWKPRGFVSTRMPTAFLKTRRLVSSAHVKEGHG
ncbi:high-affinity branched-chain amino acid ABC transporter permease LivM [Phreatobacter aquaticus]|uniref:High-affinity branched-chain amino acid ABC transporter permease LivM n=1 Tax=Phreatobacter aquaticus TaxID=2570229 RepID=A0A4D7QQV4_9HYPH|nr:high-affinity branched-chain amino acid ABC transporter permease LivM [Phreatobacter aquaticus]QCK87986.1 high-affinity branched-chain amino acid ABC transporter permease LivM [Phreatobacter aquaticus]